MLAYENMLINGGFNKRSLGGPCITTSVIAVPGINEPFRYFTITKDSKWLQKLVFGGTSSRSDLSAVHQPQSET